MGVEIKRVVVSERQHGTALLLAVVEYPACELPGGYFDTYYTSMRDNVTEWLHEREIPRVRDEYAEICKCQHSPHFARYDYRLKCHTALDGQYIEIECEFVYSRGSTLIKQSKLHHIWSLTDGLMLKKKTKKP